MRAGTSGPQFFFQTRARSPILKATAIARGDKFRKCDRSTSIDLHKKKLFVRISTCFYIENDVQNITFFIFFKLSKTMYFHEKSVIISLFLVRFQIRLNHMKDLLILHVTKEKHIKKVLYRSCKIAKR